MPLPYGGELPSGSGPPRPPSAVPLPAWEGLRGTLIVLAATAVLLLGIGWAARSGVDVARGGRAAALPEPTATRAAAAPTPAASGVYQVPGDLCQAADFTALRPTFNQIGDLSSEQDSSAGFFAFAQCVGTTGNDTVQGTFSFRASVYVEAAVARQEFEATRRVVEARSKTVTLSGVGDAAYDYVDPAVGPIVEIYDGNLRIRLSWGASDRTAQTPEGTTNALIKVCQSTMMLLREN